jgi:hypothetical protein
LSESLADPSPEIGHLAREGTAQWATRDDRVVIFAHVRGRLVKATQTQHPWQSLHNCSETARDATIGLFGVARPFVAFSIHCVESFRSVQTSHKSEI